MTASLYEIIELPNGDVVLRRVDEDGEPLLSIRFSPESQHYLKDGKFEIAKAMIEAGMETAGELLTMGHEQGIPEDDLGEDADVVTFELEGSPRVLH